MDSQIDLQQPVLDGGIRSINFFNGRLLSARDLTLEQSAYREADRRLGKAVGDGVAYGLEVSQAVKSNKQSPAVSVEAGLAVNRRGQTLLLDARADIALVRTTTALASSKVFSECQPLQTGAYVSGAGVYLLTIAPAQTTEGRATTNGLSLAAATCNSDTIVNAVQFRLIQLDPPITSTELQDRNHLRNLIAFKCFGVDETAAFIADPFRKEVKEWGLLDELRSNQLTDCEVPLAILYWTDQDGLNFLDMWSVRRRLIDPVISPSRMVTTGERHPAESEAMVLQFQDQLAQLCISGVDTTQVQVTDHFTFLPPVGLIPLASTTSPTGFKHNRFFQGITYHNPIFIEGAKVEAILRQSLSCKPVDLASGEMIWLYQVRENTEAIDEGSGSTFTPYMIFASGYVPFIGDAQYDLSRWNYSNYS